MLHTYKEIAHCGTDYCKYTQCLQIQIVHGQMYNFNGKQILDYYVMTSLRYLGCKHNCFVNQTFKIVGFFYSEKFVNQMLKIGSLLYCRIILKNWPNMTNLKMSKCRLQ